MNYDFDRVIDRRNTYSIKYTPAARGKPDDVLPMWVADMDFSTPPCVTDELVSRSKHGIFGYSEPDEKYYSAVKGWFGERFNWPVEKEWLVFSSGVVNALFIAVRAFSNEGDGIVIQEPVYGPFASVVKRTGRRLLVNALVYKDGRYTIDFDDFENQVKQAKLFILCNPHNPVGRVWERDELIRMGEICLRHGVIIIADEIHQDFVFPGRRHLVLAGLDDRFRDITVTCTAPSKTFNLAGLMHANNFIANNGLRNKFLKEYADCGLGQPSLMGLAACEAAYSGGCEWLDELLVYLGGNITLIREYLSKNLPKIKLVEPEGTYLAWLDFTELRLPPQELEEAITHKAKLWLNNGTAFGKGGEGFQRMNTACPRSIIHTALERLKNTF